MRLIHLSTVDSTNTYVKELLRAKMQLAPVCVWADEQTNGRGQLGANWEGNKHENLFTSVGLQVPDHTFESLFRISILTALALLETLEKLSIPRTSVKWPNDILIGDKKLAGILIETIGSRLDIQKYVVIGVGLNINQMNFTSPRAVSLKSCTGKTYQVQEVLLGFINQLEQLHSAELSLKYLLQKYESKLYKAGKVAVFELPDGCKVQRIIKGVNAKGQLELLDDADKVAQYNSKEIILRY